MNEITNIHEAKTHLSRLVDRALRGEEVTIGRAGKPQVKLVPIEPVKQRPAPGLGKDDILWIAPDFDAPLDEFEPYRP